MRTATTTWGRTQAPERRRWQLTMQQGTFTLTVGPSSESFAGADVARLGTTRRWFGYALSVHGVDGAVTRRHGGLTRDEAAELDAALGRWLTRHRLGPTVAAALQWHAELGGVLQSGLANGRWIATETIECLEGARPSQEAVEPVGRDDSMWTESEINACAAVRADLRSVVAGVNERILAAETESLRGFFDEIESKPLTPEQIRAVVCFDNRVNVIASAGSGKTSVMVARAAYAVKRDFVKPERILLLAFNKTAAVELQDRVDSRLKALGLAPDGVRASTFHSFGLNVIGRATGRKPRPAPWLEGGQDVDVITRIADELRDRSASFAFRWDLFRLLYARASEEVDGGEPDHYDKQTKVTGFRTANNEVVKSEGERILADWLFYNGVRYQYERPYVVDVADREHSQYRPDFYYPDADVWHEHWALDAHGEPPASFTGYAASMAWKRHLHQSHGTTLVETTWAEIIDFSGLRTLGERLMAHGLTLDWNPDRSVIGASPTKHEDLARLVRTFMAHVKSNSLTRADLDKRLAASNKAGAVSRGRLFLDLYWEIHDAWQAKLRAEDCVDFEDMLVQAAAHLERGDASADFDLVMVDEFQDASQARARLVRSLLRDPGKHLLVVGDDWQSINRFAGADISVMTQFEQWFGSASILRLQTTFRCPQSICDVATAFVTKNPRQLTKQVTSAHAEPGAPVSFLRVKDAGAVPAAIRDHFNQLSAGLAAGEIIASRKGRVSVDVLGRYNFDRQLLPAQLPAGLDVTFRTVHNSKGLEADYVIVPNLTHGLYGFPSKIVDDPVLELAMTNPDQYPHAEERRLFYVALTRARRHVLLIGVAGWESPFLVELLKDGRLATTEQGAGEVDVRVCPSCHAGTLVQRKGPYGLFLGCSTYPRCRHSERSPAVGPPASRSPI